MARSDQLFVLLHQSTPIHQRGKDGRETMSTIIALSPVLVLDDLFVAYKQCRSREPWIQKLMKTEKRFKTRESLLTKFRAACLQALTNSDMWCDLYLAAVWSKYTKISLQICTVEKGIMLLEDQGTSSLTLKQPSSSSCKFSLDLTTAKQTGDICSGSERMIRQCVRASRYTLGLDGATGQVTQVKKEVTQNSKQVTQKKVTQNSKQVTQESGGNTYMINPATGRKIKVGSKTHRTLIKKKTI